jgi:oligosaccharide translocation protein RFT1
LKRYAILERPDEKNVPFYALSILICAVACLLEFCGEPANAIGQMCFLAKQKAIIEASSLLIFHLFFVGLAISFPGIGSLSYAIARLIYSLIFVYLNFHFVLVKHNTEINEKLGFKLTLSNLLPFGIKGSNKRGLDNEYLNLTKLYFTQSVYKQILTEGERYLITAFSLLNFSESGIYDIINNLGSLIARFIFLPIEDASYVYFTNSIERGIKYEALEQSKNIDHNKQLSLKSSFENLLKAVSLIGVIVLIFGQGYSQLLLQIYGGDRLGKYLEVLSIVLNRI